MMNAVAVKWEELDYFYRFEEAIAWVTKIAKADPFNLALRDLSVGEVAKRWANSEKRVLVIWKEEQAKAEPAPAEPAAPKLKRRLLPGPKAKAEAEAPPFRRNAT